MEKRDPLFDVIARDAVARGEISTSYIQQSFQVGYNRAGRVMMQLERAGVVAKMSEYDQPQRVLFSDIAALEYHLQNPPEVVEDTALERESQVISYWLNDGCKTYTDYDEAELSALPSDYREWLYKSYRDGYAEKLKKDHRKNQLERVIRQELIDEGELFGEQPKRPSLSRDVVDAVYKRDCGRCVYCGSTENLQLDHIIPFSRGGATTLENMQLLCQKCNLEKSNKIG